MIKRLYLGRATLLDQYELGTRRKDWRPGWGFHESNHVHLASFCPDPFEEITGIKLKPGEIHRVKSITIALEEGK